MIFIVGVFTLLLTFIIVQPPTSMKNKMHGYELMKALTLKSEGQHSDTKPGTKSGSININ